ncbi:hypothetical protein NIES2135_53820 [Leptolyngbya boryana NIES-2135]|jgi:hypothetical protein|uniref:Uncharacterized protein n=1 Tax=Leptolyngbya boryana NIES-2135 TaxID=1973484 RepID=A0A1Z4JP57_LEPBY|nr:MULTISPECIES: hypothetical protein [Leptolyngbya]BAY58509.1 hypothetical protein NIES2135_53820 [Leptolyngbya boryana NIES-2135]MBD2370983.1 hypothetical protein [Leptolyngbya sp. FACHB-161]MBD2377497.1 hypothetical protein [Leptolyngbya sp. FACHB-238]MBD2401906.1 hypothetical protein [Leptolyngbya sp. FACHB-239]MBD2408423.1 hypothetical protein [Leptolyngbya sp. FACHB-402]
MFKSLAGLAGAFNRFKSLTVVGLNGEQSEPFGMSGSKWSDVEKFANGLPWDFPMGELSAQTVNDAKGDRVSLQAQLEYWKEYRRTQEQNLETFAEIQKEKLELGKSVLSARYNDAQNDLKLSEAVYKHNSQMGILQRRNANAEHLARLQMELGIKLEDHKHNNNRDFEQAQFGEQAGLETARLTARKASLVDRYRALREQAANPTQKEPSFAPTPGRVIRFGRKAG